MWTVHLKYSYCDLYFDFKNLEDAGAFVETAVKSYNKERSDDKEMAFTVEYIKKESRKKKDE